MTLSTSWLKVREREGTNEENKWTKEGKKERKKD
jgi:hypothetical protein